MQPANKSQRTNANASYLPGRATAELEMQNKATGVIIASKKSELNLFLILRHSFLIETLNA